MGKKLLQLRSILRVNLNRFDPEELRISEWRRNVIKTHEDTSKLANNILIESRRSRRKLEQSWDEAREVINTWNSYENRYKEAISKLSNRIVEFEEQEREQNENSINVNRVKFAKYSGIASLKRS